MNTTAIAFSFALILPLAACFETSPTPPAQAATPAVGGDEMVCKPEDFAPLMGEPESALWEISYVGDMRIIRPGMAVTMDYKPARLNIEIGEDGRIVRIYCG